MKQNGIVLSTERVDIMQIFIPGNVPSLKNSKIATTKGVFASKTVRHYLQDLGIRGYSLRERAVQEYQRRPNLFRAAIKPMLSADIKIPHLIGLYFIRDSNRQFDWINAAQIIFDLLVAHRVITDDSMRYLVPSPFLSGKDMAEVWGVPENTWYCVDKERAGVIIDY